ATSVRDDVGVPDAAPDDNAKAMSICNDIDEADAVVDDNVKKPKAKGIKETQSSQVPISDVYNTPIDNGDIFIKDAHDIINHANPPIHRNGYIKNHKKTIKKTDKHGHKNQKSTKRSQRIKAEARKVKP
ncbi:hypothetical protein Tco_1572475, partial [Tanacetum coccineum]